MHRGEVGEGRVELPENLVRAVADEGDPRRSAWLDALPGVVEDLAARWSLTLGPPFQPGGQTAWVGPAGADRVLKVGWRHPEDEHEAQGLRAWADAGAVEVHATWRDEVTSALLLGRCRPGTPLARLRSGPEQDVVIADLLRRLWRPAGPPFRPLAQLCDLWAEEVAADPPPLDPGLVRAGLELFRALPREPGRAYLLATDLHAENVLAHDGGWRLIDPKPYVGDRCYDLLQHLLNQPDRVTADPHGSVRRMAELTGLDPDRTRHWAFARAVVESTWSPWVRPVAVALRP
jgi:streptomycin 6-kinase